MKNALYCGLLFSLTAFSAEGQEWSATPEWTFIQKLNGLAWECNSYANKAIVMRRATGVRSDGTEINNCLERSAESAQEIYKSVIATTKYESEIKSIYAKWMTYLESISTSSLGDDAAKLALGEATEILRAELQAQ